MYNNETIHVALCLYDIDGNYSKHAAVTMTSIFMNTQSKVIVHLVHDNTLSVYNKNMLINNAVKYNQTIDMINIRDRAINIFNNSNFITRKFTIGSFYRLFLADLLPNVNKVIYLDCDIIVEMDIKKLWDAFDSSYPIAAVHDYPIHYYPSRCYIANKMGLNSNNYFCSGVLILNIDILSHKYNIIKDSILFFNKYMKISLFPDQDFLNYEFKNNYQQLDTRYNTFDYTTTENEISKHDIILHLVSKPWIVCSGLFTERLYWGYFNNSTFANDSIYSLIEEVRNIYNCKIPNNKLQWKNWLHGVIIYPLLVIRYRTKLIFRILILKCISSHFLHIL